MRILGIDNGLSGGLVVLEDGRVILAMPMPVIQEKTGKKIKNHFNAVEIATIILEAKADFAVLEKSQAYPKQGGVSNHSTGIGFGIMLGVLAAYDISHVVVHPKTWQKALFEGMAKGDTKAMSAIVCGRLWPEFDWRKSRNCKKAHDGMTDAALLAEYGRRLRGWTT